MVVLGDIQFQGRLGRFLGKAYLSCGKRRVIDIAELGPLI